VSERPVSAARQRWRDLALRSKLMLVLMLATVTALLVASVGLALADRARFRREMSGNLTSLAEVLAENSTAALTFDDAAAAAETLGAVRARRDVLLACLYDADGTAFATYEPSTPRCPERAPADGGRFAAETFTVVRPVLLAGKRVGTIELRSGLQELDRRLRLQLTTMAGVLLLSAAAAAGIATLLQRIVSRPILRLAAAAARASAGQYQVRAAKRGNDEVGRLVDAFNGMLEQIQRRDAELLRANEELERRVEERTRALGLELADRVRAENALEQRNVELARSNQELDDFAYVASHDLKEPLRGIHNYATFLLEDYGDRLDPEGVERLRTLTRLTTRMEQLIDSLLHYSRVGRLELQRRPVDLQRLLDEQLEALQHLLRERRAEVRVPRPLPVVTGDRERIAEVLRNLITNAVKYNESVPRLVEVGVVEGTDGGPPPVIYVRDNGIGIKQRHQGVIFGIFKRLHGRDEFGGGAGVGLTIVKKIVERHGGRVWLESEPGAGTTFYFTLQGESDAAVA
jgi:signal transduction histidine kinase